MIAGPGDDRTQLESLIDGRSIRLPLGRLLGLSVTVLALVALLVGAVHGIRSTAVQAGARQVGLSRLDVAYYDCLEKQVASVVNPGETVAVSTADPGAWVTLSKVVAPREVMTTRRNDAVAVLSLEHHAGGCLGTSVVARYSDGVTASGRGATLRGAEGPPASPL